MRPLFSYYGGKQRMASKILPLFPPHTVYVEPFCGGATLLFAKPIPVVSNSGHYQEVLNDHDQRIMTIYRVCQNIETRDALLQRLDFTPYSRAAHDEAQWIIRHGWGQANDIGRAWAMLVCLRQGFSNTLHGGWSRAVLRVNHASIWNNWRQSLRQCMDRLANVYLECDDALAIIRRWDSPQTLFYCDPPYMNADQGDYAGYTEADLMSLVTCLDACQGSFVLSGYAHKGIPDTWECVKVNTTMTAAERVRDNRVEHIWRVDRSANISPKLQRVLNGTTGHSERPF